MTERGRETEAAQGRTASAPAAGDLLVASVALQGDAFDQTVVLVLDVNAEGVMGLVLNRPTDTLVEELLPGWGALAGDDAPVSFGGPVALDGALALARPAHPELPPRAWVPCVRDIGFLALDADPAQLDGLVGELRVFVGYAGWGPGQLEAEMAEGLWHVLPSCEGDAFDAREDLWRRVLARTPGELAYFATWTPEPELN